jgi:GT2 family glycosyltransferase
MVDLTISIGTIGNYPVLERCLRSIYKEDSPGLSYEVWVVYNGSGNDGVVEKIEENFPQVSLINKRHPLGYCVTHNLVLRQCNSRYVLVLDDDTIVQNKTLLKMVRFMDAHPKVGIAGCKTLNADGTFQKTFGVLPNLRTELRNIFRSSGFWPDHLYKDISSYREVPWLNGSFMFVRSEVLKDVGLLDEHYYTYVCESDWCYRISKSGWQVVFVPEATIIHIGGEHSLNTTSKRYVNLVRYHVNRYYFFHKHYNEVSLFILRPLMVCGVSLRIFYFLLLYLFKPIIRDIAKERIKAFCTVIRISLLPKPYNFPESLQFKEEHK